MVEIKHRYTSIVLHTVDAANLRGANLRDADLYGADLRGANLRDADLYGADLRGANLRDADLYCADLRGADLRGADLCGANLRDADLCGADLRDANLRDADLRGANLRGANLRGANLRDATRYENENIETFTRIERIGSRADTLTLFKCTSGIFVETGCFAGTLTQFEAAILYEHNDNKHAKAYGAAIALAKILFA